ncbi:MAG: hypothetical protein IT435_04820 [Phycisphaerales bacterium]|nr:hypothetical protein [Phycisphaerales bacterium]
MAIRESRDGTIGLESRVVAVGGELTRALRDVIAGVSAESPGPAALARSLGLDKVLASRVLKAVRAADPLAAAHLMPGPDPLRRLVKAAGRRGASTDCVDAADRAITSFESLIRDQAGDRSTLDAILSAWIPEARREFELRRKQAAFKAISQLKGVQARVVVATVVLFPSPDGEHIDVVWINGLIGLHRVRPGVVVKLTTRRMAPADSKRKPANLDGFPIDNPLDASKLPLPEFCSSPMPALEARQVGETVFYTLGDSGFGSSAAVDLVFAEVNRGELPRFVPAGSGRKAYFFAEVTPPTEALQFDVLLHEDLYRGRDPILRIYDTSFEGVASVNDPAREIDRLDMLEAIDPLGIGLTAVRSSDVPHYAELVRRVFDATTQDVRRFRGYRCRVEFPLYGTQVCMAFEGVEK